MSRPSVVWLQEAIDELAEIWLAADDRGKITAASDEIDRSLASDAAFNGKPLSEGLRIYDAPPLRPVFSLREDGRCIEIARIRRL